MFTILLKYRFFIDEDVHHCFLHEAVCDVGLWESEHEVEKKDEKVGFSDFYENACAVKRNAVAKQFELFKCEE